MKVAVLELQDTRAAWPLSHHVLALLDCWHPQALQELLRLTKPQQISTLTWVSAPLLQCRVPALSNALLAIKLMESVALLP